MFSLKGCTRFYLIKTLQVFQITSILTLTCAFSPERIPDPDQIHSQRQPGDSPGSQKIELGNAYAEDCNNPYENPLLLKATGRCFYEYYEDACPPLMMVSQVQNSSRKEGECTCKSYYTTPSCAGRPTAFFPKERRCYFLFQQGPCKPGEWLVVNKEGDAACQLNPCQPNQNEEIPSDWTYCSEGGGGKVASQFYFLHDGNCYKTKTQAFCPEGQEVDFPPRGVYPICRPASEWKCPDCELCRCYYMSQSPPLNCPNGMKRDVSGVCLPVVQFNI